jgi:RNA-directed DNA polymerase
MQKPGKRQETQPKDHVRRGEGGIQLDLPALHPYAVKVGDRAGTAEYQVAQTHMGAFSAGVLERIADPYNLLKAYQQVKSNKGASGVDKQTIAEVGVWLEQHYHQLGASLLDGSYHPHPVRGIEIPKPDGGIRRLGIPTVLDRVVQQAISQVLARCYEPLFSTSSYGYRPGRGAHQALKAASRHVQTGGRYVVDLDLSKFFDEVNHDRLIHRLSQRIGDKRVLRLIGKILRSGIMLGGLVEQTVKGTPQGSPLSPLLSNIVLDELDKELDKRGHRYCRYADDIVIFCGSQKAAERLMRGISAFIEGRMKLKVNQEKSRTGRVQGTTFLGYSLLAGGKLGLARKNEKRLKDKLRQITKRNRGVSLEQVIAELNLLLRGWLEYYKLAQMKSRAERIGEWLRHRLRCYRLKQGKRAIGIYRFLRSRGISNGESWKVATSSKGWYRLALTPQSNMAMNHQWFLEMGLLDIKAHASFNFAGTA